MLGANIGLAEALQGQGNLQEAEPLYCACLKECRGLRDQDTAPQKPKSRKEP